MQKRDIRTDIIKELELLSQDKLQEILDIIHFSINSEKTKKRKKPLGTEFAGVWLSESADDLISMIKSSRVNRTKEINL